MAKTMKKCFGLVLAMLFMIPVGTGMMTAAAVDGTNLLQNPGFEEVTEKGALTVWSNPADMTLVKPDSAGYMVSPDGGNYIHLAEANMQVQQTIADPLPAGNYALSTYVKFSATSASNNSHNFPAMLTVYVDTEKDGERSTISFPQSEGNNFNIYNTRGEWRRVSYIISVPADNAGVRVILRSTGYATSDLCYDGVSFTCIGEYDEDALVHYAMDDVADYGNVAVPTEMTPYSNFNTADMSYGVLGTNYKATQDTPSGTGYAMEMTNDGTVTNGLSMVFHTGTMHGTAVYEVSGYIKVDSEEGYAKLITNRHYAHENSGFSLQTFYDTNGAWKKFTYKFRPNLTINATNYPAGTVGETATGSFADRYTGVWKIMFTGTGSVKFDDIRITRLLDENRVGYNNNLAVGGDFESIGTVNVNGLQMPNSSWTMGSSSATPWTNNAEDTNGIMLYKETENNTVLRVATDGSNDGYVRLISLQLIPDKLYRLSWRQRAEEGFTVPEGGNIRVALTTSTVKVGEENIFTYKDVYNSSLGTTTNTEWATYTQYIRYPAGESPEGTNIYFRPTISGDSTKKLAYYIDDVELCMVDEKETYGAAAFTEGEGTVTTTRTLLHEGTTWDEWATAKTYAVMTAVYTESENGRQLYDIKLETKNAEMMTYSARTGIFAIPAKIAHIVDVPATGTYTVETYLWDSTGGLVPLDAKTVMQ